MRRGEWDDALRRKRNELLLARSLFARGLEAATANWGIVDAETALTAGVQHRGQALAPLLQGATALGVARGTVETDTLVGRLPAAVAHGAVVAADGQPVIGDVAADHATGQHRAEILH